MGAWIETRGSLATKTVLESHPVWVRGLKLALCATLIQEVAVAPRVGAWIETKLGKSSSLNMYRRTPCGCVD